MAARRHRQSDWLDTIPYRLWRAAHAAQQRTLAAIADLGVTITQLGFCVHLDEFGPMSGAELARMLRITPQSTTTAMRQLVRLGWVVTRPHESDGRIQLYELTALGRDRVAEARVRLDGVDREVDALLGDFDREQFIAMLEAIEPPAHR